MKNSYLLKSVAVLIAMSCHGATFSQIADNSFTKMIASGGVNFVKQPGDTRTNNQFQVDCAAGINLSSCVTPSNPKGCPAGQVWSTTGSGIAHCVGVDPMCGGGTDLIHDSLGNPQCAAPTISYENQVGSCPSGYTGQLMQQRTVIARATGAVEYGAWTTVQDLCVPPPPAPPPAPPPPPPTPIEPPAEDPLCLRGDGGAAKIGERANRCNIENGWGNAGGYQQGEYFLCTASGWKHYPSSSNKIIACE